MNSYIINLMRIVILLHLLYFDEKYPWLLNEPEKELTEEKLSNICKKYMDELGIADDPDFLELEYYG